MLKFLCVRAALCSFSAMVVVLWADIIPPQISPPPIVLSIASSAVLLSVAICIVYAVVAFIRICDWTRGRADSIP